MSERRDGPGRRLPVSATIMGSWKKKSEQNLGSFMAGSAPVCWARALLLFSRSVCCRDVADGFCFGSSGSDDRTRRTGRLRPARLPDVVALCVLCILLMYCYLV
jgi:hypothetical protein